VIVPHQFFITTPSIFRLTTIVLCAEIVVAGCTAACGWHPATGYMITDQPCHAGGGCSVGQVCIDGFCARSEVYLFGDPARSRATSSGTGATDGGDE
jgi:hypothetical protein